VAGGLAVIREDLSNIYARWHMNESSGNNVSDDSGNGRNGTRINAPTWIFGKLNNCLSFNGSNQYVDCNSIASFERTDAFSVEAWIKTPSTNNAIISKAFKNGSYEGWILWLDASGYLECFLINNAPTNLIQVRGDTSGLNDDAWHHVVMTYDGSSDASGVSLYVDGSPEVISIVKDTLSGTIINSANCNIGGAADGVDSTIIWNGEIDEAVIYDRVLLSSEVTFRYNSDTGRENFYYYTDSPTIYKTAGDSDVINAWSAFTVTEAIVEGSLRFQLSSDAVTWYYWDGAAWSVVGASDYNTEATVNTNIGAFPTAPNKIYVKTFFISDGTQRVEIDLIEITYTSNQNPLVNAGTNKACKDNQTISPFSDCTFSDPDGTVDFARYKVDGEVDVWTNIPQGGYATLLEAVQAFEYAFNNVGVLNVQLQVEDDEEAKSDDNLTVTVTQYTRIINIKDSATDEHLSAVEFNPGDGSGSTLINSPTTHSWNYSTVLLLMQATGYYSKAQSVLINTEADLDLTMEQISYIDEVKASVGWIVTTDTLVITTWLLRRGGTITTPTSCTISFKDEDGNEVYGASSSSHVNGVFKFENNPSGLPDEGVYRLDASIVYGGVTYPTLIPLGLIDRRINDFITNLNDDVMGKWVMDVASNPMTLTKYKLDGVTILKKFNLATAAVNVQPIISRTPV
jgi:hypothetical protein